MELRKSYLLTKQHGFDRNNFLFRLKEKVLNPLNHKHLPKEKREKPEIVNIASPTKTMFNFIKKTNRKLD